MARSYDDIIADTVGRNIAQDPQLAQFAAAATSHFEDAYKLAFGLGEQLAARRTELHLSQSDLAERAGVPQADISRIERGKGNPTLTTVERILLALDVRLEVQPLH